MSQDCCSSILTFDFYGWKKWLLLCQSDVFVGFLDYGQAVAVPTPPLVSFRARGPLPLKCPTIVETGYVSVSRVWAPSRLVGLPTVCQAEAPLLELYHPRQCDHSFYFCPALHCLPLPLLALHYFTAMYRCPCPCLRPCLSLKVLAARQGHACAGCCGGGQGREGYGAAQVSADEHSTAGKSYLVSNKPFPGPAEVFSGAFFGIEDGYVWVRFGREGAGVVGELFSYYTGERFRCWQ